MGLCQHVYRRGALYWWRRRFVADGCSQTIAISLRLREPRAARCLGATLNVKAYEIANRIGFGMTTITEAQEELTAIVGEIAWSLSDGALASLDLLSSHGASHTAAGITRDQQIAVLRTMTGDAESEIARGAAANRLRAHVDGAGRPLDPEKESRAGEIALAVIYRTIAEGGRAARSTMIFGGGADRKRRR